MTKYRLSLLALSLLLAAPLYAGPDLSYVSNAASQIQGLVSQLVPLLIAIGLLVFIWGVLQFILSAGDAEARSQGIHHMVWGIIALFVMVSVWGLVGLLNQITGVSQGVQPTLPIPIQQ